jgi:hypothetical protein
LQDSGTIEKMEDSGINGEWDMQKKNGKSALDKIKI